MYKKYTQPPADIPPPVPQFPCSICSRTFRKEALERHEKICQKSQAKKRKVYDSSKKRIEGTEIATVNPKLIEKAKKEKPKAKSDWRAKHDEFIRAIRAAKGVSEDTKDEENETSVQQRVPIGYVQCPTCGRNFNERAADRHMPWCKDQKARNSKSPTVKDASDRLKARTKYRAPLPNKKDGGSATSEKKPSPPPTAPTYEIPEPVKTPKNPVAKVASTRADANNNNIKPQQKQRKNPPQKQLLEKRKNNINMQSKEQPQRRMIVTKTDNIRPTNRNIMKFKERFPNHIHRNIMTDENYDGFQDDLRELLRQNKNFSREPRTVPGVRTGGHNNNAKVTNSNPLNNRFDDLNSNFKNLNGDFDINWAKKYHTWDPGTSDGLPQIGSSEGTGSDPWAPIIQDLANTRVSTGESSTSSDGTLPPISRGSSGSEGGNRLPRFCHQCGTKYPIQGAKYCCECGARRLAHGSGSVGASENFEALVSA